MIVPPIKSQGIKTKLVPWILDVIDKSGIDPINSNWVEPFFGTGVVGFNSPLSGKHIVGDTNPHIINFYNKVKEGDNIWKKKGSFWKLQMRMDMFILER